MRIFQVLDALDYGDGVGNDAMKKEQLLKELGIETRIYSKYYHESVKAFYHDITKLEVKPEDIVLHHYSGKSHTLEAVKKLDCKKVLVYHNITPPQFFSNNTLSDSCTMGIEELKKSYDIYDYIIADSEFNLQSLQEEGIKTLGSVLPILIDFDEIANAKFWDLHDNESQTIFSFIGRVAPNKKHIDIIKIFDYYYCNINSNSKLYFVGDYQSYPENYQGILRYLETARSRDQVFLTGKVPGEELYNYYKNSDMFICMSEHEGFCLPLLESMYCQVPTMAYNAGAVASTMGMAGILVNDKSPELLAKIIYTILSDVYIKNQILEAQNRWVNTFSRKAIKQQLEQYIEIWKEDRR